MDGVRSVELEVCCGSFQDAMAAWRGGAQRIELNSALFLGGLTPSAGSLILAREHTGLRITAMVRPRGGGFCYDDEEYEVMCTDARILLENGADGIAFGFLRADCTIDEKRTEEMTSLIHGFGADREAVFHRAFDCTEDLRGNRRLLRSLGVDRILTSGGAPAAPEGADMIRALIADSAEDGMQILPGCGIHAGNAVQLAAATGACRLHSSCRDWREDPTSSSGRVSFAFGGPGRENAYDGVSEEKVRLLVSALTRESVRKLPVVFPAGSGEYNI